MILSIFYYRNNLKAEFFLYIYFILYYDKVVIEENERLNEIVRNKSDEINSLKDLEEKISLLLNENEELNKAISHTNVEVEHFRDRYQGAEE